MTEFKFENLKELHLFIEGGGDDKFVREALNDLHPGLLEVADIKVVTHAVNPWPDEPYTHAYVDLRLNYDIELSRTNCFIKERQAFNKNIYFVWYIGDLYHLLGHKPWRKSHD